MAAAPGLRVFESTHEPLLGTRVQVRLGIDAGSAPDGGADGAAARATLATRTIVEEIRGLERVFSVYDDHSELCRWRRGELDRPGAELTTVLTLAADWHRVGRGAFHPATGVLSARWRAAAAAGVPPTPDEMGALAETIERLPFEIIGGVVVRRTDCGDVDLNAIAKGHIVDRAVATAIDAGLVDPAADSVLVNAGGDLVHRGVGQSRVGIEDPFRPFDNVAPTWRVEIRDQALATSGSSRRGVRVGGTWFGHVIDPRTGWPVAEVAAATVIAPDAATADAVATVVGVLPPDESLAIVAELHGVSCCVVDADGHRLADPTWGAYERA